MTGYALVPLIEHDPYDLLWSCHVGLCLTGLALLWGGPRASAAAFLWVWYGWVLWALDALNGRELGLVTIAVHCGGAALASWAVGRRGWPAARVGWVVILGLLGLQGLSRLLTAPAANVNLAYGIRTGWEGGFSGYAVYWTVVFGSGAAAILLFEAGCRRWLRAAEAA